MVGVLDCINFYGSSNSMITLEQLQDALVSAGLEMNPVTGQCIVDMVNSKEGCLIDKGLSECNIMISQLLVAQLIASNMGSRVVNSIGADVLKKGWKVESLGDIQKGMYQTIVALGGSSCFSDMLPTPINAMNGFAFSTRVCK